jgi:hypothetical protein
VSCCRKINFAVSQYTQPPVEYITRLEAAETRRVFKPQKMLEQFPSATSLHIDAYSLAESYAYETLFSDVGREALEAAYGSTGTPSLPDTPCQITDLVINSTVGISLLSDSLSLPVLARLHVSRFYDISDQSHGHNVRDYQSFFSYFHDAAVAWKSLQDVKVCIRVTLGHLPDLLDIWNFWVRSGILYPPTIANNTLANRPFEPFPSIPSQSLVQNRTLPHLLRWTPLRT